VEKCATTCLQAASNLPFTEVHFIRNLGWGLIQYFCTSNNLCVVGLQEFDERSNELPQDFFQFAVVETVRVCRTAVSTLIVAIPIPD
tara:strand:+ start:4019 stop:4279 length:261 start_codon:yes stop_codon:yes gene_type:complete